MSDILIWQCSPRAGGVTDTLADFFARGAMASGANVELIVLRDFSIVPCKGCDCCRMPPHACILERGADKTGRLFQRLEEAKLNVFASPIYFYALPAHFKAFIDRGQSIWARRMVGKNLFSPRGHAIAIMAAGRPGGEQLFSGAIRTLSWFLKNFDRDILEKYLFRGLEGPSDLAGRPEIALALEEAGRKWASRVNAEISVND